MSSCISNCCKDSTNKNDLFYNNARVGTFYVNGYYSISSQVHSCLGISKPHNLCAIGNNKDMLIFQNDNIDKEVSIFIALDKHKLLLSILPHMPQDCKNAQIVFIFEEDNTDSHKICKKAQNSYKKYTSKFFACKRKLGRVKAILINN